jgi:uncharacterized protein (TIGR02996 family)
MNKEQSFLKAIRAKPDDEGLRLVYADWLEEQDDPRGPFLRVACALRKLPEEAAEAAALRAQLRGLRPGIRAGWVAGVCRELAEDDVREAVFRFQFRGRGPGGTCFLQIEGGRDPSRDLLERLTRKWPGLRPYSSALIFDLGEGVANPKTGVRGVVLRVDAIRWLTDERCEVDGGYYLGPLAADGNTYEVAAAGERWVVGEVRRNWIS